MDYQSLMAAKTHTPRILVVDDEAVNRLLLQRILRGMAEVVEAENGQQTLELLERQRFDLVLLDIMMPGITGLEVLKIIRATHSSADLPVILISALSNNDDIVRGLQTEANDYIPKPIDVDVVMARVETQLKLKTMTDTYRQSIAELEAAQQLKDRLFGIASHDLKSPLSTLLMAHGLLNEALKDRPDTARVMGIVLTTINKMNEIIEEFLELAACQSGNIDIKLAPVKLETVLNEVATYYSVPAAKKNIQLEVQNAHGIAQADSARLQQVLNNLVSNAIKFSPRDSTITLSSEAHAGGVRIYVADQGPGIPENERERLFKEFSKLTPRPTGGESSTGLGLWIVKHMVMLQGGMVGVDCPPEGGSTFWVALPSAISDAPAPTA